MADFGLDPLAIVQGFDLALNAHGVAVQLIHLAADQHIEPPADARARRSPDRFGIGNHGDPASRLLAQ